MRHIKHGYTYGVSESVFAARETNSLKDISWHFHHS
ncbi:hypothetical protein SOVF_052110, partial [Spinacia oleracea]